MTYAPTWSNADAQGLLVPAGHIVCLSDAQELAAAINRRGLLTYHQAQDFSSEIAAGMRVRKSTIAGPASQFHALRTALLQDVLQAAPGALGGSPPTPQEIMWLWPQADADENKKLVAANPGEGEVSLFAKINASSNWTDPTLTAGASGIRAVHWNEMRQAVAALRRGRIKLPLHLSIGLFSILPDTPWLGEAVANNGVNELRTIGFWDAVTTHSPARGLVNVDIRPESCLELTAEYNCTVQVYRCLRELDYLSDRPTWNRYDPSAGGAWSAPGGTGQGDATLLGSIALSANVPAQFSSAALISALQDMADGARPNILLRRSDTGYQTIGIIASVVAFFDLKTPPN